MFDTSSIMQIVNGEAEDSIKLLQSKIASANNYMLRDDVDISNYKNDIADLMTILLYLKETDTSLLGLWQKRTTQISSHSTALHIVDANINNENQSLLNKIKLHIPTLIDNIPNISAFGDVLFYIDVDKKRVKNIIGTEEVVSEIIVKRVSPRYYVRDRDEVGFSFIENSYWTKNNDTDKSKYIYIRDKLYFMGGLMRGLAIYSLAKQSNLNSWFNGNNRLFSAIIASYNSNDLLNFFAELTLQEDKNASGKAVKLKEAVELVYNSMDTLSKFGKAVVPDAMKFEQQKLVDSNIGDSYEKFISAIERMFEVAILGQSGTTNNDANGSFAKAKVMNITTDDIKWADMNYAKELVNKYISRVLPALTQSIKPEDIEFSFVFDDSQDIASYSELLSTMSSVPLKTLEGNKGFVLPVTDVFKGLGMQANTDYYKDNDLFVFGDNDNNILANRINNNIDEEEDELE